MNTPCERAVVFACDAERCVGIVHESAAAAARCGVLVVVGGPQYRIGSHRQFVTLARHLARDGHPVFRFDYRGMGDSEGVSRDFRDIDLDIRCAVDSFFREVQGLRTVVIFALCDAASAALLYCTSDTRIGGLILANPWVRTASGLARVHVKHYYLARILQRAFWRKLARGKFSLGNSGRDFFRAVRSSARAGAPDVDFIVGMRRGLQNFSGPVLLLLSGHDHTAAEFLELGRNDPEWSTLLTRGTVRLETMETADHTFSSQAATDWVNDTCARWLSATLRTGSRVL